MLWQKLQNKNFFSHFYFGEKRKKRKIFLLAQNTNRVFFLPHSPNNTQPNTTEKLLREKMGKKKNEKIMYICNRTFFLEQFFLIYEIIFMWFKFFSFGSFLFSRYHPESFSFSRRKNLSLTYIVKKCFWMSSLRYVF